MSKEPGHRHRNTTDQQVTCPNCEAELDWEANFCVNCGIDVSAITTRDSNATCPDCTTAVRKTDNFCISCGTMLPSHQESPGNQESDENAVNALESQTTGSEAVPESLILAVEGHEISVSDGDTVGSEIRAALSRAGRSDSDVVRIHREHVRFLRKSDSFYVLDMGDNPTHLNGVVLTEGEQKPVSPGDELELSAVAGVTIRYP